MCMFRVTLFHAHFCSQMQAALFVWYIYKARYREVQIEFNGLPIYMKMKTERKQQQQRRKNGGRKRGEYKKKLKVQQ